MPTVKFRDRIFSLLSGVKVQPDAELPTTAKPLQSSLKGSKYPHGLDTPLVWFSPSDPWSIRDACEGTQIIGETGSGKTSGSGQALAKAFLRAGFGGLVLTHKSDERERWEQYCKQTGRLDSLMVVNPDSRWRFNFLEYQYRRSGEGAGHTENAVSTFMNVIENRYEGGKRAAQDSFWTDGARRLLRYSLDALIVGGHPVTMDNIMGVIHGIPFPHPQSGAMQWPARSLLQDCLARANDQNRTGEARQIEQFFLHEFARPGTDRQSAGIVSTFTNMADPFLSGPVKELFCSETNFIPEFSRKGAIILLDLPSSEWEEIGRAAQLLFKYMWQRAIYKRQGLPKGERPVFLWADEAQTFATNFDRPFQESARSSVAATVYLTQSISNIRAAMDPQRAEAQADALLGNLATKIFHRQGNSATNEWAANTIAKGVIYRSGGGTNESYGDSRGTNVGENSGWSYSQSQQGGNRGGSGGSNFGVNRGRNANSGSQESWHETTDFQVQPELFTRLKGGGPQCNYQVQSIIFKAGKRWNRTGRTFLDVTFPQN